MKLTNKQIKFLNKVCRGRQHWALNPDGEIDVDISISMSGLSLFEIPIKFGTVSGNFYCRGNNLTTLKNFPTYVKNLYIEGNNLTDYFKSIKEEDFPHWDKLYWGLLLNEYPFLINIGKKYLDRDLLNRRLKNNPQLKLYLKD